MNDVWKAAKTAYKAGWWKTRANKEGQLSYMFVEGVRYAQRWIPIENRDIQIPNDEDVLIRLRDGTVRRYGEEWENEFGLDGIVTHWARIPKFNE